MSPYWQVPRAIIAATAGSVELSCADCGCHIKTFAKQTTLEDLMKAAKKHKCKEPA